MGLIALGLFLLLYAINLGWMAVPPVLLVIFATIAGLVCLFDGFAGFANWNWPGRKV